MVDFHENIKQQIEPFLAHISGSLLASLVVIKGLPGSAELAGAPPFSGADGLALDKAFGRLGWGFGSLDTRMWFGLALFSPDQPTLTPQELRFICELIDPLLIVTLDDPARLALIDAFISEEEAYMADFTPGAENWVLGRHLVSVDGFEAALEDEALKQRAWAQLKRCTNKALNQTSR